MFDCFKGLIGFCKSNECLWQAPVDMRYVPESGIYLDRHIVFKSTIITEQANFFNESNWENIADADQEARQQLGLDLVRIIRTKVQPGLQTRTIEIGENEGSGYHSTPAFAAVASFVTRNVPDAVFYLTHIGVRALIVSGGPYDVGITLKKNGTPIQQWDRTVTNLMNSRYPLDVPYAMPLDGSVYSFEYNYNVNIFPVKNPMDCGCATIQSGYNCFFMPFEGDAGGIRLLGELRCNENLWPCSAVKTELAGLAVANAYRSLLVKQLLTNLITSRAGRPSAFTLLKPDDVGAILENLQIEYANNIQSFSDNYNPSASCCFEAKSFTTLASAL